MKTNSAAIREVRFVASNDPGYVAYCKRAIAYRREHRPAPPVAAGAGSAPSATASSGAVTTSYAVVRVPTSAAPHSADRERVPDYSPYVPAATGYATSASRIDACVPAGPPVREMTRSRVGQIAERAARRWLGGWLHLESKRVLAWRECDYRGTWTTRYQEIDAVCMGDDGTVTLFEVKLTTLDRMQSREGRSQLERAARVLRMVPSVRRVATRLVYIGDGVDRLLAGTGSVAADDLQTEFGAVWITPDELEWAARDLGAELPPTWRTGHLAEPAAVAVVAHPALEAAAVAP